MLDVEEWAYQPLGASRRSQLTPDYKLYLPAFNPQSQIKNRKSKIPLLPLCFQSAIRNLPSAIANVAPIAFTAQAREEDGQSAVSDLHLFSATRRPLAKPPPSLLHPPHHPT